MKTLRLNEQAISQLKYDFNESLLHQDQFSISKEEHIERAVVHLKMCNDINAALDILILLSQGNMVEYLTKDGKIVSVESH